MFIKFYLTGLRFSSTIFNFIYHMLHRNTEHFRRTLCIMNDIAGKQTSAGKTENLSKI